MGLNSLFIFSTIVLSSVCLFVWLPAFVTSEEDINEFDLMYGTFSEKEREQMLEEARRMFNFAFNGYMKYAFPKDELNPISCTGRGPEWYDDRIKGNGVVGNYLLTLVDSLDTLAIAGYKRHFQVAVAKVIGYMDFKRDVEVLVFEANIRVLGGLLSAHLIITDPKKPFGDLRPEWYNDELLKLAEDLGLRLLQAFVESPTGLPYSKVNLRYGVPKNAAAITCPAAAGTFILEFGVLSRLTKEPIFEEYARKALRALWHLRSKQTGLVGNSINMETGYWTDEMSGLGAGMDSFYEYLLKSYILFGETFDLEMFAESYKLIKKHMRIGRAQCNEGSSPYPLYMNVNMYTGELENKWIDSLQAFFPGLQVLYGDIEDSICSHFLYYGLWKRYGGLPERYNWATLELVSRSYPLRPELMESTYLLYQATKNPFYLHVGREIIYTLNNRTRTHCGYGGLHDVEKPGIIDHMESFFLSETCKYLILLFDKDNYVNKHFEKYIFTTEGHLFPVNEKFRLSDWEMVDKFQSRKIESRHRIALKDLTMQYNTTCDAVKEERKYSFPLKNKYVMQVANAMGIGEFQTLMDENYDD